MASVPTSTGGFDLSTFLQATLGAGSAVYNATQSGSNAQTVAQVSNPFLGQNAQYQPQLATAIANQNSPSGNPSIGTFQTTQANQTNPYTSQFQSLLTNQSNPYTGNIQNAINNPQNAYASEFQSAYNNQQNPYQTQLNALLKDPNSFQQDPGYQFALSQGQQAIERSSNALYGTDRAGALSPELAKYTEGYAEQAYDTRIGQLTGLSGQQQTSNNQQLNTLASAASNQNSSNNQNLATLGNLSGQQQTTNTNQLNTVAGLIGTQNNNNINNLGALNTNIQAVGNVNNQGVNALLQASGATTGNSGLAGQALVGGQQNTASSIGAALAGIPALAPFASQIMQLINGGSSSGGSSIPNPIGVGNPTISPNAGSGVDSGSDFASTTLPDFTSGDAYLNDWGIGP